MTTRKASKIIAACGNDCAACPRYNMHPCEKTEAELHHTAELWMKIGYRDRIVSNGEIVCTGCRPENWCRYRVVKCCTEKGIRASIWLRWKIFFSRAPDNKISNNSRDLIAGVPRLRRTDDILPGKIRAPGLEVPNRFSAYSSAREISSCYLREAGL